MVERNELQDHELDALFSAAASDRRAPSADLMARVMADAQTVAAENQAERTRPELSAAAKPGLVRALLALIGGWPAAAGLATAAVAGLAIGLTTPDTLETWTSSLTGYGLEDFMVAYDGLLVEG